MPLVLDADVPGRDEGAEAGAEGKAGGKHVERLLVENILKRTKLIVLNILLLMIKQNWFTRNAGVCS